ncbi:PREDICTED: matrix-remodeling-associated protein 5 [Chrysochloris asiatica]|uniref:Matrix-remodeling-associated protein 5 n=1 Tax=Chrysochloris asiatica TaxID=185453 RepID=A0A9B0UDM2_CHRAS|nr:PREDICTED: matrix-remodeling-associated protein 5 [Chrysochloris asiatica]
MDRQERFHSDQRVCRGAPQALQTPALEAGAQPGSRNAPQEERLSPARPGVPDSDGPAPAVARALEPSRGTRERWLRPSLRARCLARPSGLGKPASVPGRPACTPTLPAGRLLRHMVSGENRREERAPRWSRQHLEKLNGAEGPPGSAARGPLLGARRELVFSSRARTRFVYSCVQRQLILGSPQERCIPRASESSKMPLHVRLGALSLVLILLWGPTPAAQTCPHPCACYVASEVHCTFRSLASVPAGINKDVERINLGFNSIQAISDTSFSGMAKLELLMIHGNDIPSIPDGALRDLTSLQVFKFSYNKLRVITKQTFQGLSNLVRLHVDHNRIEFIHPQALNGLMSLRLVHLEGNLLHHLHPHTFSTFSFLDHFRLSTVRHLYLAENAVSSLPTGMLQNMPLLENLYLHGNPWACGCDMKWLLGWEARSRGILKCKKDKSYEGGQLCAMCSSPQKLQKQEIHKLKDIVCAKPLIDSPLRQNRSGSSNEEQEPDEDGSEGPLSLENMHLPTWNISLNMTDEHGNTVNLACSIKKPTDVYQILLNQTDPFEIEVNATVALDFECPMTRENYEKLWKLIAYYSEVPLKLQQERKFSEDGRDGFEYRQDADEDALYYTGVKACILAEPAWVLQPSVDIQLNRRQSTAKQVLLSYYARFMQTVSSKAVRWAQSRSWLMMEPGKALQRAHTVLEGGSFQLSCPVRASESPSISWVLPDGSVVRAPTEDLESKFSILSGGHLKVRSAEYSDSGLYQCIAQVRDEEDRVMYRVSVQVPVTRPSDEHTLTITKSPGEPVTLPCNAEAIPEAQLSWVLPSKRITNHLANTSHAYVLDNGTLSIPKVQASDGGYYRCVAVNLQGTDHFTVEVVVNKKGPSRTSKRGRRPGGKSLPRIRDVIEDEGGSGVGGEDKIPRQVLHPMDQEVFIKTQDGDASVGNQKTKKGRRKLKLWKKQEKEPETNVAEGRRAFESRRRVNMSNKQINPERWADILARVRGRNVLKGTTVPQVVQSTATPSVHGEVAPLAPAVPPPSVSLEQTTSTVEDSSADMTTFSEREHVSNSISPTKMALEPNHHGAISAEPKEASVQLGDVLHQEVSEKIKDMFSTQAGSSAPTQMSLPYESSSLLQTLEVFYEEPTYEEVSTEGWFTAPSMASVPLPTSNVDEVPLESISLAESETQAYLDPDSETNSQVVEVQMGDLTSTRSTPTSSWWTVDPRVSESFWEPDVPTQTRPQGHTDNTQPTTGDSGNQGNSVIKQDVVESSQTTREGNILEVEPTDSGYPRSEELGETHSIVTFKQPGETTLNALFDRDTLTVSPTMPKPMTTAATTLTTPPLRRKSNGRRRLRLQRFRHRHKQTLPLPTSAPPETFSTTPAGESTMKGLRKVEDPLVLTPTVEGTVGIPKQLGMGPPVERVTKGTSRRKQAKKQNKHRHVSFTVSWKDSEAKTSSSPDNKHIDIITPSPETLPLSAMVPLKPGEDTHETSRAEDDMTGTPKLHLPLSKEVQGTIAVTFNPTSGGEERKMDFSVTNINGVNVGTPVFTELATDSVSTLSSVVSTVEGLMRQSYPLRFPGTPSWTSSGTTQPWSVDTSRSVSGGGEIHTDPPLWEELEKPHLPNGFSPSVSVSTQSQRGDVAASTTPSSTRQKSFSSQVMTTTHGQHQEKRTPMTIHEEMRPQDHTPTPNPTEEPDSPSPPTTMGSLVQTPTTSAPLLLSSSHIPTESRDNILLNYVGVSETKAAPLSNEGSWYILKANEASTPSSKEDVVNVSPKHELVKEVFDGEIPNTVPRGPESHHHDGRGQTSHQRVILPTKPIPPRETTRTPRVETTRTPRVVTQRPFKYLVTTQPSRHMTNQPEIAVHPWKVVPESKSFVTPKLPTTTAPILLQRPRPGILGEFGDHRTNQFNAIPKVFGNNNIPDQRSPMGKPPSPRYPPHSNSRFPFFFNKTFVFPQLGTTAAPVTRDRKVIPGSFNRIFSQSVMHVDFGPPAPPLSHPPRATLIPSTNIHPISRLHSTQSSIPFTTSPSHPFRNFHQSSSRIFSVGGPPASKFWTLGEKPQISTKSPPTVFVTAESDAVFPCEATGKPMPYITWTKVSTGALMTPNTRTERFQVLKNGTLVIRKVQVQDHGQYLCTATNLHGADTMRVVVAVKTHQPQFLASHYQDVTVYLGDTIAMECLAKGTPAPQISWIFPDRRVWHTVSPAEGRVTLHENRTLSIKDASFADMGVYKCVASNAAGADSLAIRLHVAALPPAIQQEKQESISLPPGLSIHIHCTAKAAPLASVRWVLDDGTQVRPSQFVRGNLFVFPNGTLYIRHLAPKDSGRYECVATNLVGSARRTVQLTVQRAAANARITSTSPRRSDVRYGSTLRLDCSASGDPRPRTQWRLPSQRMVDTLFSYDPRIMVFANGTLVVKSVTEKDAGDYLCVTRNKIGEDYVGFKVNVVMKPAKIEYKEDQDHMVVHGDNLKVDCVATGLPNPEISWSLPDGSVVNPFMQSDDSGGRTKRYVVFNNGTLYFNEVGKKEEGDYTCFAENQMGKDAMTVHVKVVAEPAAIRNKTYSVVQVPYGDVVTVTCESKGEPTPRVNWLSPTNREIPASSDKYQVYQDGTLLIRKAQRSDSGNYTCVVRNSAGEDRKVVGIQVQVQPPRINGNSNAVTTVREIAVEGSRKLVDCRAQGIPVPRALWAFPEGVVLPAPYYGNRISVHRNGTLDIRSIRRSDSVQFVCIARNEGGEARLVVQLTVLDHVVKPIFHDPVSEKITAIAGHTISLNCSAAGTPAPTLLWVLPNGTEVQSGRQLQRFYHKSDGRLHISGLASADAGAYRCIARNPAGYSERLVSLRVGLKPTASSQQHGVVSIINGETLHLSCPIPAGRPARFSWTLPNGMLLNIPQEVGRFTLLENGTLTVHEASVFERGTYTCKVDTEDGSSFTSIPVIIIAYPPRITSEATPVIYTRPGSSVKMNCLAMGVPKAQITWELPDKSHLAAGAQARIFGNKYLQPHGSLTIQHVSARDSGFYKCVAENVLGRDSKTTYIHIY